MAKGLFGKKQKEQEAGEQSVGQPAAADQGKPPKPQKGKFTFHDKDASNYSSSVVLGGKARELKCRDGVITTDDPVLADHLRTMFSEVK